LEKILGFRTPDCADSTIQPLPDIEFSFFDTNVSKQDKTSSRTIDLTLEPKDYMVDIEADEESTDKNYCLPGFVDNGMEHGWSFGILFIKKFFMIYDFKNEKIGFVRANNE
jgi:hypothetical protein